MSLVQAWRRQLYGASSVALIVPGAMLAALLALAFAGGFSQVGVLKQIFAGPSLPSSGPLSGSGAGDRSVAIVAPIPAIPVAPSSRATRLAGRPGNGIPPSRTPASTRPGRRTATGGLSTTGGAVAPISIAAKPGGGTVAPVAPVTPVTPVRQAPGGPTGSAPTGSSPKPPRPPARTPVQTVVNTVTSVTQQVPGPAGPVASSAVQTAGGVAENLLPAQGLQ